MSWLDSLKNAATATVIGITAIALAAAAAFARLGGAVEPSAASLGQAVAAATANPEETLSPIPMLSHYRNLSVTASGDAGPVAFVAGSHEANFPYWGTAPWDNALLLIDGEGYTYLERKQGAALQIDIAGAAPISLTAPSHDGHIRFDGTMRRACDGRLASVRIDLAVTATDFDVVPLGVPGVGMFWQPSELDVSAGTVVVDGRTASVRLGHGELEAGTLTMPRGHDFGIAYDYTCVAAPGSDGYSFVAFLAKPLAVAGTPLDLGSRLSPPPFSFTLEGRQEGLGNRHEVRGGPTVLFEDAVDLGIAVLERRMVRTTDDAGRSLFGLVEVFDKKDAPPRTNATPSSSPIEPASLGPRDGLVQALERSE